MYYINTNIIKNFFMRVLVIEDNEILNRNLVRYFASREIFAEWSLNGEDWLHKASTKYYDVVVLDINLPWIDGYEICKKLREKEKDVSIIMLTSNSLNSDIVAGLDIWADDYLVKPFEYSELLARINAITRRKNQNKSNTIIKVGDDLEIDLQQVEVKKNGELIQLSKLEYELFKFLAQNKWKMLSRQEIYEKVWWEFDIDFMFSKTIDVYRKDIIETKKWYWFLIR